MLVIWCTNFLKGRDYSLLKNETTSASFILLNNALEKCHIFLQSLFFLLLDSINELLYLVLLLMITWEF